MNKKRIIPLILLLIFGSLLVLVLFQNKPQTPLKHTLAPAFQIAGKSTQAINKALSKVIPVNELDEKQYGEAIALRYKLRADFTDNDFIYLNDIIQSLSVYAKKPFNYRVYVLDYSFPNAFALPGGVILVTKELLNTMNSEAEIVSILAHEMGHIEREHCFNTVKYEVLFKKLKSPTLGKLTDFAVNTLLRHSYSKTQENEADEYAYEMILQTQYDPKAVGNAFISLKSSIDKYSASSPSSPSSTKNEKVNILRDYFMTHPPLPLRIEKFSQQAELWWKKHPGEKRYTGKTNLTNRICFDKTAYKNEWKVWKQNQGN